ncbi:MAG: exonuclease SbcCD subunit D [Chloroflexota bacterium]
MTKPLRVLHFADAHIDIANYGRHDPKTGLPIRVMDFLQALDQVIETAVSEKVDLVIFAGDAYKDRNPQPTYQREWGKRMMRLSQAQIPTVLLVGNHDVSPAAGRAHTLQEFRTFSVDYIHVADRFRLLGPDQLGIPAQVITVPWISPSQLMARRGTVGKSLNEVLEATEEIVAKTLDDFVQQADPSLPLIMTAHASVRGAKWGSERAVMLGHELTLGGGIVNRPELDYVALGHIHKHQCLTAVNQHPPVVYPGSIERIDFGELRERKGFVLAEIARGKTEWRFVKLKTRPFYSFEPVIEEADSFMADIMAQLPDANKVEGAICRVQLTYPRDWEPLLDEKAIADHFHLAFSIQIQKQYALEKRSRLGDTIAVESLTPDELLEKYWQTIELDRDEAAAMQTLAKEILGELENS